MRCAAVVVVALAVIAPVAAVGQTCALQAPVGATMPADQCLACHGGGGSAARTNFSHPVDIDYASARAAHPSGNLRTVEEVTRRGVPLPGGMVRCATCHDAKSPWAHWIFLPPGEPAVAPFDPARPGADDGSDAPVAAQPGGLVSAKPLCRACHGFD